jgi:small-conductance mechanosensitive channel
MGPARRLLATKATCLGQARADTANTMPKMRLCHRSGLFDNLVRPTMKTLKWFFAFTFLFLIFCALAAYPTLHIIEWLPICPKNPQTMHDRECGYNVIWLWPLLTMVASAFAAAIACRALLQEERRDSIAEQSKTTEET